MKKGVSTVVFDLGGVLIDWNPRHLYRKILSDEPERMEWFLSNICTPEWNAQQDAGRTMQEACDTLVREHPEHEELIRAYYDRWEEMITGSIEGTVDILRKIRDSSYSLYGLTNWSGETFPVARERFEFLSWFEGIVVSGDIGLIKPDRPIFDHLIRTFDLIPEETVFIDDSAPNVETASAMGFRAIRFESPEQLQAELGCHGVHLETQTNERLTKEE